MVRAFSRLPLARIFKCLVYRALMLRRFAFLQVSCNVQYLGISKNYLVFSVILFVQYWVKGVMGWGAFLWRLAAFLSLLGIPVAFEVAWLLAALSQPNHIVPLCSGASFACRLHASSIPLGIYCF